MRTSLSVIFPLLLVMAKAFDYWIVTSMDQLGDASNSLLTVHVYESR